MAGEFLAPATLALMLAVACGSGTGSQVASSRGDARGTLLTVSSPDLPSDLPSGTYPRELTCEGGGRPPVVVWAGGPAGTRAVIIELLDPDAPGGVFTHWLVILDGSATGRLAHPFPRSMVQGRNSAGHLGYYAPCPLGGPSHHYHLMVLSTSSRPRLAAGFTKDQLDAVLDSGQVRVLARAELVATYQHT